VLDNAEGECYGSTCVSLGIASNGVITAVWAGATAPGVFFAHTTDGGNTFTARSQIPIHNFWYLIVAFCFVRSGEEFNVFFKLR